MYKGFFFGTFTHKFLQAELLGQRIGAYIILLDMSNSQPSGLYHFCIPIGDACAYFPMASPTQNKPSIF